MTDILDNALIVASELLANAVEAAPGAELRLHLRHVQNPRGILFRVWDPSPRAPLPRATAALTLTSIDAAPEDAWDHGGGWGLPIVQSLSTACGHTPTPPKGKWVWSHLTS
ncbi:ATP-binding protein [Actinocorallia herbida]|nr:ATP-binding protein [Actinocorallia herbida]